MARPFFVKSSGISARHPDVPTLSGFRFASHALWYMAIAARFLVSAVDAPQTAMILLDS
jgi:hypothetical protein